MKKNQPLKLEVPGTAWESGVLRMESWDFELEEQGEKREVCFSLNGENTGSGAIFSAEQIEQLHTWLTKYLRNN